MMLKNEDDNLNTLRVASKDWSGLVYYQGVTSRTTLSTAEKATQTITNAKHKKLHKTGGQQAKNDTSKPDYSCDNTTKTNAESEKRDDAVTDSSNADRELQKETKSSRVFKTPRSLTSRLAPPACSTKDESLHTDDVSRQARSSIPDKTLLPLPNVSWNEMSKVDEEPGLTKGVPLSCLLLTNQRNVRPHTAGPRVIVPLKHTCPVGLGKEDIIRGTRLGGQNSLLGDIHTGEQQNGLNNNILTPSSRMCSEMKSSKKEDSPRKFSKPVKHTGIDTKLANLELTITSIQPESFSNNSAGSENSNSDSDKEESTSKPNNNNTSPAAMSSYNFNTMEGIRKSYRRAQSAPPTHHRHDRMQCGNNNNNHNNMPSETVSNQKPFSNLYWRAKSAYHKRLEATSEEEPDDNVKDHRNICHTKHTLLRPLLRVDSEIKHSAGCPYKCKGCFKACLVSEDYVQKAIARAVDESEMSADARRERYKPHPVIPKADIVKEALRRSQPLFRQVYGGGKMRGRVKIRPWPNYGWMDLKMKKEDGEFETSKTKDGESDE